MRMRFGVMMIGVAASAAFLHCGGGDDSTGAQASDAGSNDSATDAAPVDAGGEVSTTITVAATLVVAGSTTPLANRAVVIIDANDVVTKLTTDANGKFGAPGVQAPYDIAVPFELADAANTVLVPRYFAGISRVDPIVPTNAEVNQAPLDLTPLHTATIKATLNVCNGCGYNFYGCSGESGVGNGTALAISYPCMWQEPTSYSTAFHAFVTDATGAYVSGLDLPSQSFNDGDTVQLGTLALVPVTNEKITVTNTVASGFTFTPGLVAGIQFSDGIEANLSSHTTLTNVLNYPFVPNVWLVLDAQGQGSAPIENSSVIATYPASSVPATLTMNVLAAPTLLTPADSAASVSDSQAFTWSAYANPTVYTLTIYTAKTQTSIYTTSPTFDPSKLTKAGLALTAATPYTWLVTAGGPIPETGKMDDFLVTPSSAPGMREQSNSLRRTFTTQ